MEGALTAIINEPRRPAISYLLDSSGRRTSELPILQKWVHGSNAIPPNLGKSCAVPASRVSPCEPESVMQSWLARESRSRYPGLPLCFAFAKRKPGTVKEACHEIPRQLPFRVKQC